MNHRLKAVLKELIDEFFNGYPGMFENWFITNEGKKFVVYD